MYSLVRLKNLNIALIIPEARKRILNLKLLHKRKIFSCLLCKVGVMALILKHNKNYGKKANSGPFRLASIFTDWGDSSFGRVCHSVTKT